jgi:hypothetical protein
VQIRAIRGSNNGRFQVNESVDTFRLCQRALFSLAASYGRCKKNSMHKARLTHCHFCGAPRTTLDIVCGQCGHERRDFRMTRRWLAFGVTGLLVVILLTFAVYLLHELNDSGANPVTTTIHRLLHWTKA